MKTAIVTGATSGIGKAIAEDLAQKGWQLILVGRRTERLAALQAQLNTPVYLLPLDVRKADEVFAAFEQLPQHWSHISLLVNNAGLSQGLEPIQSGSLADWDTMIDTNVKGLLYVTKAALPYLIKEEAIVLNIGSIAGKEVYPNGNVYCASKHAVDALTQGMRLDLLPLGIRVSAIHPGLVETEFSLVRFKGDAERAEQVYKGYKPLTPHDVAAVASHIISAPNHVNIADVVLFPKAQASAQHVKKQL